MWAKRERSQVSLDEFRVNMQDWVEAFRKEVDKLPVMRASFRGGALAAASL